MGDGRAAPFEGPDGLAHLLPVSGVPFIAAALPGQHGGHDGGPDQHREPSGEDGQPDGGGDAGPLGQDLLDDAEELQPHDEEDEPLQDELDCVPGLLTGDPVVGRQDARGPMAGDEAGDDRGHEPAAAHMLGGDRREEGDREGHDRVDAGVGDAGPQMERELADRPAHGEGHEDGGGEVADDSSRGHGARRRGGAGGGQDHEGGGVVEQALALQDGDDALRDAQAPGDGDGHGVGGAENGAHGDGPRQGQAGDDEREDPADDRGGQAHQQDRQNGHGGELTTEVDGGDVHRGGVQERGEDPLEDDLRPDLDGGHDRQEAHDDAAREQQERRGHPDAVADLSGAGDRQQARHGDDEEVHGASLRAAESRTLGAPPAAPPVLGTALPRGPPDRTGGPATVLAVLPHGASGGPELGARTRVRLPHSRWQDRRMTFRALAWRDGHPTDEAPTSPRGLSEALAEPTLLVWADLVSPTHDELTLLATELSLDPHAVEDAVAPHERPKASQHSGYAFFVTYTTLPDFASTAGDEEDQLSRVAGFSFPGGLVTIRASECIDTRALAQRIDSDPEFLRLGSAALVHVLLDLIVDGYFETVQDLDDAIESLEDDLFSPDSHSTEFQRAAYDVRTKLVTLRHVILPMREVVNVLWRHRDDSLRELDPYYADLTDHVLRATEWTESLRDMIASVFETHLSLQDQRLNNVMKKLAGWAAVISVPTLVTGWFGINVPYPGAGEPSGLISAAILVVVPAIVVYAIMRRNDWI